MMPGFPSPPRPRSRLRPRHLSAVAALAVACVGDPATAVWGRGEAVVQLVQERATRAEDDATLDLADLAPFRWEAMYVLAPGTPVDSVQRALGAALPGGGRVGAAVADSLTLLVFTAGADVLAAGFLPRGRVDVDPAATGRRYGADGARFRVEPVGEGQWRLVPAP